MIVILLLINIVLDFIILFTTSMVQNHYKKIDKFIKIFADKKVYKSQREITFISDLLERYSVVLEYTEKNIDVEALIKKYFYEYPIGKFRYTKIKSFAVRGKIIMWGVFLCQLGLDLLTMRRASTQIDFIVIIASALLCMLISLVGIIKSIPEEEAKLIVKLEDYIVNTYPAEMQWQKKEKNIKNLEEKVQKLEQELQNYQEKINPVEVSEGTSEGEEYSKDKDVLSAKDIMNLLDQINIEL